MHVCVSAIVSMHAAQLKCFLYMKFGTQALFQLHVSSFPSLSLFSVSISTTITTNCFLAVTVCLPSLDAKQYSLYLQTLANRTHRMLDRFQQRIKVLQD